MSEIWEEDSSFSDIGIGMPSSSSDGRGISLGCWSGLSCMVTSALDFGTSVASCGLGMRTYGTCMFSDCASGVLALGLSPFFGLLLLSKSFCRLIRFTLEIFLCSIC